MTDIQNFDSIRVGTYPVSVDVHRMKEHSSQAISCLFQLYEGDERRFQLRKKGSVLAMLVFKYGENIDEFISDVWKDSEILWDSKEEDNVYEKNLRSFEEHKSSDYGLEED